MDIYNNAIENLNLIKEKTKLIDYDNENIYWKYDVDIENGDNMEILKQVQIHVASKYTNINNFYYSSKLEEKDFDLKTKNKPGEKLYNRCLENVNYCFICEENNKSKLKAIKLNNSLESQYDINNYLLLCESHANKFENNEILILEDGTAVENNKELDCRLEINVLKKIRKYLR